jgi:hypothetical protein
MGIKRVVDTSFWTDGKVDNFSPEDKYFMLYLLSNPFSKQLGIYEISIKQAAFQMGYSEESFRALLERFEKKYNIILYSKETDEIAILNFLRHSVIKGGKPVEDCIRQDMERVKNKTLIDAVFLHLQGRDGLNVTVKKIVNEYINNNKIHNDNVNDNDNDRTDNESYNDSFEDEPKPKKSKAEKEREAIVLKVCEMLGKHDYNMFSDGAADLQNALVSFVEFRKGIKKPMTDKAIDLLIGKLKGMTPFIYTQIDILNQSIMNGWQGIFPLKIEAQTGGRQPYQKQTKADELNDFYNMAVRFGKG